MNRIAVVAAAVGTTVIAGAGLVWYARRGPAKGLPNTYPGYQVIPNCGGVTVTDEAQAITHAEVLGAKAAPFTTNASSAWVTNASAALDVSLICESASFAKPALGFTYRLLRGYIRGALTAGKIDATSALNVVSYLRSLMLSSGVDATELPEGLPGLPKPGPAPNPVPGPGPGPKPPGPKLEIPKTPAQLEAEACAWAVASRPTSFKGLDKAAFPNATLAGWLARVAYKRAYPELPDAPTLPVHLETLSRLLICVTDRLTPSPKPTPDRYYQSIGSTNLYSLASLAYGALPNTAAVLAGARAINSAEYNRRFWKIFGYPQDPADYPPDGARIAFEPVFGPPETQANDPVNGSRGGGTYYPLIFIPKLP